MNAGNIRQVGPWSLVERLGVGGNAVVWKAQKSGGDAPIALKVINAKNAQREPYQRFVREIEFLRQNQSVPGVLPLVDAHLPDRPTKEDQPWLAMPIATPITDALSGKPLSEVVEALASIADALWRLQRDLDLGHRDVKPGNLYNLDGEWLIGDFGLIAVPDVEGLTTVGKPLGPTHYTAYELVRDPTRADPHKADIYSLGKTLWTLATEQAFPPHGHQPTGSRGFAISDFRPHPRSAALDQEIDLMTRLHPEERPTKEQVAKDLKAWIELDADAPKIDVSAARAELRRKIQKTLVRQDTQEQQRDLAHIAVRRLQQLTKPLNEALKDLSPNTQIDLANDKLTNNMLKTHAHLGRRSPVFSWQRCTLVAPLDRPTSITLRMGRSLELLDDGQLILRLMVFVGPEGVLGVTFRWQSPDTSAPVGTVEAEKMLEEGVTSLADALQEGVDAFVQSLPEIESDR